jgi:TP901 family phage tail tape measure protein
MCRADFTLRRLAEPSPFVRLAKIMADEIVQQLGFDASSALEALAAMDTAFGSFEARLSSVAESMETWNACARDTVQVLKEIASGAIAAAAAMSKLAGAFGTQPQVAGVKATNGLPSAAAVEQVKTQVAPVDVPIKPVIDTKPIKDAEMYVRNLTLSWATLARVVETQFIVRAMSMARDAIKEAYTANVQFVKSLSEVRAISPERDLAQMSEGVKALSREFNVPIEQVVEAKYQAISNQFVSTSQQANILRAAAEASKVGLVDMGKAAEIVSAALNVYGKDSSEAEAMTAKMFKAVGEGHIRFADLANIISRVGPTARELGVSFDELLAAIDALSIGGMKPAEVATSLRASMTALFKPSKDLREELQGLSAEQMIAVNGLVGSWAKLRGDTNGTIAELAKLVGNIRGMNAVLRETGTGAEAFASSLGKIKAAGAGEFKGLVAEFRSTDVEKVTSETNKLAVFMATDFGASLVKAANSFLTLVGGADKVISALKALAPVAIAAAAGLVAVSASLIGAQVHTLLVANSLTMWGAVLQTTSAGLLAYGTGLMVAEHYLDSQRAAVEKLAQAQRQQQDAVKAQEDAHLATVREKNEELVRSAVGTVAKVGEVYRMEIEQGKEASRQWAEDTKGAMESLVSAREHGARQLRDLATEANHDVETSHKRASEVAGHLADTQFRYYESTWNSAWQRQQDFAGKAFSLTREAEAMLSKARTPQDESAAQNVYKRAEAFAQESMSIAQRRNDTLGQQDAEKAIEAVMRSQIDAEGQLQAMKKKTANAAAQAAAEEEAKANQMRVLLKDILKEGQPFDTKGAPLPANKREENFAKLQKDMAEFQSLAFGKNKWQMSDLLNFAGFKQKMELSWKESTTDLQIQAVKIAPEKLAALNWQLTHGIGVVEVLAKIVGVDKSKLAGLTADQAIIEAQRQTQAQGAEVTKLNQKLAETKQLERDAALEAGKVVNTLGGLDTVGSKWMQMMGGMFSSAAPGPALKEELASAKQLRAEMEKAATAGNFGWKEYVALAQRAGEAWQKSTNATTVQQEALGRALEILGNVARMHDQISKSQTGSNLDAGIKAAESKLEATQKSAAGVEKEIEGVKKQLDNVQAANNDLSMSSYLQQLERASQLLGALANITLPSGGGEVRTAAQGGMTYLEGGGRPRGTDVIPAMLSPGEMVMSAATSRRFASQLTAMNAGVQPSYHSHGGGPTHIGDINLGGITVQGGKTGYQTARDIASGLRRELRRGTSIL